MFDDEKPKTPVVPVADFKLLAEHFLLNTGRKWTEKEASAIYDYVEKLIIGIGLYNMALEGFVMIEHDGASIVHKFTKAGETMAMNRLKMSDKTAVDSLLRDIK